MVQQKIIITVLLCLVQIFLVGSRYIPPQRIQLRPGFIQQRVLQYRGPSHAFYRNPANRIVSSLNIEPTLGLRTRQLRANRLIRNEYPLYNTINRLQTRKPLRTGARNPLNADIHAELSNFVQGKSQSKIDDNNRVNRPAKLSKWSRVIDSKMKWRQAPVSLNLGEKFSRRHHHIREGNDGSFRLGGNEYARRHRISIKSSRGRNIQISHFAEPNGRSRIIINTSLGSSKQSMLNRKPNNKLPSRTHLNAAASSHTGKTKTNATDFLKKVDSKKIVSKETKADGTNRRISNEKTATPSNRNLKKPSQKTDSLTAGAATTRTTKSNLVNKVNGDSIKQLKKVKEHFKSATAPASTPAVVTHKSQELTRIRPHSGNISEPKLEVSTTEGPDLPDGPDGPDGPDTPDGNDGPDTA